MRHNINRGALLLVGATLCIALINGCQKLLGQDIPLGEILFFRNLVALPVMIFVSSRRAGSLTTHRLGAHIRRSMLGLMSMFLVIYTIQKLPLAEQQVLSYTQPLFIALLSIPLLGETLSRRNKILIGLGFAGVIVAASGHSGAGRHEASAQWWIYVAAVGQGIVAALITLQIRDLSRTEASSTITFWQSLLMTVFTMLTLPFSWTTPRLSQGTVLLSVGMLGALQQLLQTEAFASARVSSIGGFLYCGLLWSALIGWIFFGEHLTLAVIVGSVLIVIAGIWMLRAEKTTAGSGTDPQVDSLGA